MMRPVKPYSSVEDLLARLAQRGILLGNHDHDERWLSNVGYYRLSGYWYPYRQLRGGDRIDDFNEGTTFASVVALYEFDRKLRTLVHDGIERIEVMLRAQINDAIGAIGPMAHLETKHFRPSFDHADWVETAKGRIRRSSKRNAAIKHYEKCYGSQIPIWVLSEVLDFGDVSRLYQGLPTELQWRIARRIGISIDLTALRKKQRDSANKHHPFVSWLEQLTIVRNVSAHHSRLWNRSLNPVGTAAMKTIPQLRSLPSGQSERIYGALCMMGLLLETASPGSTWRYKVRDLVTNSFTEIQGRHVSEMGFPESWADDPCWSGGHSV